MVQNKRVALTLPPQIDDVLTELSELTATPKTAIITEMLSDSVSVFEQVIVAIKQAKEGQKSLAIETVAKFLQDASHTVNQAHLDLGGMKAKHGEK